VQSLKRTDPHTGKEEPPLNTTPSRSTFDPAAVSRGTWVAAGGALVLLISVFLEWYNASVSGGFGGISVGGSGWKSTDVAKLVALLAVAALVVVGLELFATNVTMPYPSSLILIGIGGLSTLLVLFKLIDKPDAPSPINIGLSYGIFVSLIAAIAIAVGGYLKMSEA
jgi:hypothetical protein